MLNPAFTASLEKSGMSFALSAQTRITRVKTHVALEPQYVPVFNAGWKLNNASGISLGVHSPFQRVFPDTFFIAYAWEVSYGYQILQDVYIGASIGTMMGIEARDFLGWGFSGSAGFFYKNPYLDIGLFFRPGSTIKYSSFSSGLSIKETTPYILRWGGSRNLE